MSTFNGHIKEYPILSIDRFVPNGFAKHFILSHVHKDHTHGLESLNFKEKVYCTQQTALLLPLMETRISKQLMYGHLKELVVPVPYHEPIVLDSSSIKLTFLPANHCPGAALILIEGDNGTVLYTGDMRAEPNFVTEHLDSLKTYRIKNLYMDTTCCYPERRNFISKIASIDLLTKLVQSYPTENHIYLDCWTVGYEEIWIAITEMFRERVHVSQKRYTMYCHMNPLFESVLTTDPTSTRFHSCYWEEECAKHEKYMISIHPTPNKNIKPFKYIRSKQSKQLLMTDLPYNCKPFEQMILPFSTHSSLTEIVFFHKFVNPKEFTPCVARGGWETLDQMRRLLTEEGCKLNTGPSSSDIERSNASISSDDALKHTLSDQHGSVENSIHYQSTAESVIQQLNPSNQLLQRSSSRLSALSDNIPTRKPIYLSLSSCSESYEQDDPISVPALSASNENTLPCSQPQIYNEPFITKEKTRQFLKSIKELKKRNNKNKIGSRCHPVRL